MESKDSSQGNGEQFILGFSSLENELLIIPFSPNVHNKQ